jgi:hypothetical protein
VDASESPDLPATTPAGGHFAGVRRVLRVAYTGVGIVLIAITVIASAFTIERDLSMSASVDATIEDAVPATWKLQRGSESGAAITYSFVANGSSIRDTENRTWRDIGAAAAKVCFDPEDPGRRHRLVPGFYACGVLNPLQDFGQW